MLSSRELIDEHLERSLMNIDDFSTDTIPPLLRVSEVAALLQVSTSTVTRWIRYGRLPAIRVEREWRVPKNDLAVWLARRYQSGGHDEH